MTWITDFHKRTDLNRYPVKLRTRGGIGYGLPNGDTVSNFVGHPVHYLENGIWKPITLQRHMNGDLEGSPFAFKGGQVTYKDAPLFQPRAVIFDGKRYPLNLAWRDTSLVCDLPFGTYEVRFTENGVRELLTIPEPVEGLVEFDIPHRAKPDGLYKKERHIVGGIKGESFLLTKDMTYPLVIDPDYSAGSGDGLITGTNAAFATARSTSNSLDTTAITHRISWQLSAGTYILSRFYVLFDTSGIPDGDAVSLVTMSLTITNKVVPTTNFDVVIVKQDWSGQNPLGAGNRETAYDNALTSSLDDNIWKNTASITATNTYASGNLNTSWVSKTGSTYYTVMTSPDYNNTAPTSNQYLDLASQNHATSGYRPVLTVTHAAAAVSQPVWFM